MGPHGPQVRTWQPPPFEDAARLAVAALGWADQLPEIAPSVRAQLELFHADTVVKLRIAPDDSPPMYVLADGRIVDVDEDGWRADYDDLDRDDVVTIEPISVVESEIL